MVTNEPDYCGKNINFIKEIDGDIWAGDIYGDNRLLNK